MMNNRWWKWTLTACVAAALFAGAAPAIAGVSDAWVSTKVKMTLLNSPAVTGTRIHVDTDAGRVTLHGMVNSAAEKTEAERIARAGTGVASVRNLLQVVPPSRRDQIEASDDLIRTSVDDALRAEPSLKASSIGVKSVNKGVVLLSGKAVTLSDHLYALELTSAVPGVRRVASEVESPDEFADLEIWADDSPASAPPGNSVTDGWITAQVKMRFMTSDKVRSRDISVDTRRGVVTLFGTVPTSAASDEAVRVAGEVAGVRSVTRELRVVRASQRAQAVANDAETELAVRKRLDHADMKGARITVNVKASTARLSGTVLNASNRYAAVSIAYATPGVDRVENDLRLDSQQTSER